MALKRGEIVRCVRALDMRPSGGPRIPKGALGVLLAIRRTSEYWCNFFKSGCIHVQPEDVESAAKNRCSTARKVG
jgi:hypothetical protein